MSDIDLQVQRSLGNIEATLNATLAELKELRSDFAKHVAEDSAKFDKIDEDRNKAKGAGWMILGLLGVMASIIGSAVIAVAEGWIKVHS